ncbi:Zinc/iron permease [Pavlovales sp. CCMP2436]|nr:Zinc/iron permease [Pavlovales sp. CCMP2436]
MTTQLRVLLAVVTFLAVVRAAEDDHGGHADHTDHDGHDDHTDHDGHDDRLLPPWGPALGAAAIVNIVTLLGVAALSAPSMRQGFVHVTTIIYSSGFAAGALLSACFFLMFPESIQLINTTDYHAGETADEHADHVDRRVLRALAEEEHEEHAGEISVDATWRWGTCIIAGFALVAVIDLLLSALGSKTSPQTDELATDEDLKTDHKTEQTKDEETEPHARRRVLTSVLLGDALHNFADGVFIGTAFLTCDPSVGWAVTVGTVAHEISQEIADFFLLTSVCGLRVPHALLANFLSGTTIFLGVVVVLATDVNEAGVGMILATGGGIYLYNATTECMPRVLRARNLKHKVVAFALFALGAITIGLVLLDHRHCE